MKSILYILFSVVSVASFAAVDLTNVNSQFQGFRDAEKTAMDVCDPSSSSIELNINNVRALIWNGGDMWWDREAEAAYEVPKIDPNSGAPSVSSMFAGALWMSGFDDANNLKMAARTYFTNGDDFWPGPLDDNGNVTNEVCTRFDAHYEVFGAEIELAIAEFNKNGNSVPLSFLRQSAPGLLNWPGKGNQYITGISSDFDFNLAPFFDRDGDGIYDPVKGDYPIIQDATESGVPVFADQMIFWAYNDVGAGAVHNLSQGIAIKMQVNSVAFAYQSSDEVNDMTFYRYELLNKATTTLNETYISKWVDPDLGCSNDDYVGCDTTRDMAVLYNANLIDETPCNNASTYGADIPIVGIDYFESPKDTAGIELGMSNYMIYYRGNTQNITAMEDPQNAGQFRNFQEAKWGDGSPLEFGGLGYQTGGEEVLYAFPSSAHLVGSEHWSACNPDGSRNPANPEDARMLINSGPFVLLPGATNNLTVSVLWSQPAGLGTCPDFNLHLGGINDKAQALFDNNFKLTDGPDAPELDIEELDGQLVFNIFNRPSSNNVNESFSDKALDAPSGVADSLYNFQGYRVYQLADQTVTANELGNPARAVEIFQVDVKDDVDTIISFFEEGSVPGLFKQEVSVLGNNEGITRTFAITDDFFERFGPKLTNHATYFYGVIAYAYNNYQDFDINNPEAGGRQVPYLVGRKNFKVFRAIPHKSVDEYDGLTVNSKYGDEFSITRIEGGGIGGNDVEITDATAAAIIESGSVSEMSYNIGKAPITVKVTNPTVLQAEDYELRIVDTTGVSDSTDFTGANAQWELYTANGDFVATSDKGLNIVNEQVIQVDDKPLGFSVTTRNTVDPVSRNAENNELVYGPLSIDVTYGDASQRWLTFLADGDATDANNWSRAGNDTIVDRTVYDHNYTDVAGEFVFMDSSSNFSLFEGSGWSPYCLTSNYFNTVDGTDSHAPGFGSDKVRGLDAPPTNTLDNLKSVDIVFTPDPDLWSECIVFETSSRIFGQGSKKGQIKFEVGLDKDGNRNNAIGKSWFPGYAIDVETGKRLNVAFGEGTRTGAGQNATDMAFNPTSQFEFLGQVTQYGKHYVYVFDSEYDGCEAYHTVMIDAAIYNEPQDFDDPVPAPMAEIYEDIMYASVPLAAPGFEFGSPDDGAFGLPIDKTDTDATVTVKIRVNNPLRNVETSASSAGNDGKPVFGFSTRDHAVTVDESLVNEDLLDKVRIVPNPYYAYSAYETGVLDNRIKITNLPNRCVINIFTLDGQLIRTLERNIGPNVDVSKGGAVGFDVNSTVTSAVEWDLRTEASLPIASGIYIIHIEAEGIGEQSYKFFAGMRPTDLDSF